MVAVNEKKKECHHFSPEDFLTKIPNKDGERFVECLTRGQLRIDLYQPENEDLQTPHTRDECYFIVEGAGKFVMGDATVDFKVGDMLFVPAGVVHRFEDFGKTLTAWVIFYGPEGGDLITNLKGEDDA